MLISRRIAAVLAAAFMAAAPVAAAPLRIVATTPDLADLARRIGGEQVKVDTLARGTEDLHAIPMRPSFVPLLAKADAVVHLGLHAEHAFLPALIEAASNRRLQPGQTGDIDCSRYVKPMEIPSDLSRSEGELHPDGNPHYNVDPRNGAAIARALAEGFSRLDSANAALYERRRADFEKALTLRLAEWRKMATPLKGLRVISFHRDMAYFADFLGMTLAGEIEPKPGIAPSPRHLEGVLSRMRSEKVRLIIREAQYASKVTDWLSKESGVPVARIGTMGGALDGTATYEDFIDKNVRSMLDALK